MPHINPDGTITIPADIVKNMGGTPRESLVFEEWLDPGTNYDTTIEISVMRESIWKKQFESRAKELSEAAKELR